MEVKLTALGQSQDIDLTPYFNSGGRGTIAALPDHIGGIVIILQHKA